MSQTAEVIYLLCDPIRKIDSNCTIIDNELHVLYYWKLSQSRLDKFNFKERHYVLFINFIIILIETYFNNK